MNKSNQDIVAIGGYWEPLAFYRRGGGWFADSDVIRNTPAVAHKSPSCPRSAEKQLMKTRKRLPTTGLEPKSQKGTHV